MLKQSRLNLFFLLAVFTVSAALTGCKKTGEEGHLAFGDGIKYPKSSIFGEFNTRVAVGADLTVKPMITLSGSWSSDGATSQGASYVAEVGDSSIFSVVSEGATVTLRALKAGTTKVRFEADNGVDDIIELTAVDVAQSNMLIRTEQVLLGGWGHAELLTDKGFSLMPTSQFEVGLKNLDAQGNELSGQLPLEWTIENGTIAESAVGNSIAVTSQDKDLNIKAVFGDLEEQMTLSMIDDPAELTLAVYRLETTEKGYDFIAENDSIALTAGTNERLVYLMDSEGRIVIPAQQELGLVSAIEGSECLADQTGFDKDAYEAFNVVAFSSCEGSGTLQFSYNGITRDIAVNVSAAPQSGNNSQNNICDSIEMDCPEAGSSPSGD